jgi:hypothetical protein
VQCLSIWQRNRAALGYPSTEVEVKIFVRHADEDYRSSNNLPSIGAFPLHPGVGQRSAEQRINLSQFIAEAIKVLSELKYQEETGLIGSTN